jgi:hypothetical protein
MQQLSAQFEMHGMDYGLDAAKLQAQIDAEQWGRYEFMNTPYSG